MGVRLLVEDRRRRPSDGFGDSFSGSSGSGSGSDEGAALPDKRPRSLVMIS